MKRVLVIALAVASVAANAQSLYNNATANGLSTSIGIETDPGAPGGGSWSRLQGTQNTFGFSANPSFRLGDNFNVTGPGWNVSSVVVFGYNTGATTPTITGGAAEIRTGSETGAVVGSLTFSGVAFTNVYRETTTTTLANRRVQAATFNYTGGTLSAGSYWLTWNFNLTAAGSSIFVPPLTVAGSSAALAGANAKQSNAGVWAGALMGGTNTPVEMPFWINGQAVPEPGTMIALGLGAAAMIRRRRK
jgi:hypothetical protein